MKKSVYTFLVVLVTGYTGITPNAAMAEDTLAKADLVERGRYLIKVSGCNDCHTAGYTVSNGNVPVEEWLKGDIFGWSGPWGTTYGPNLRLFMKDMTEEEWIKAAKTLRRRPPMPWFNLNAMKEDDLRAIYHFTKSLGVPGGPAPAYVPVGQNPKPPFAVFPSPPSS